LPEKERTIKDGDLLYTILFENDEASLDVFRKYLIDCGHKIHDICIEKDISSCIQEDYISERKGRIIHIILFTFQIIVLFQLKHFI